MGNSSYYGNCNHLGYGAMSSTNRLLREIEAAELSGAFTVVSVGGSTVKFPSTEEARSRVIQKLSKKPRRRRVTANGKEPYKCKGGPYDGQEIWLSKNSSGKSATMTFNGGRYVRTEYVGVLKWEPAADV